MNKEDKLNEMANKFQERTGHSFVEVCRIVGGNIWWNIIEKYIEDMQREAFEAGRTIGNRDYPNIRQIDNSKDFGSNNYYLKYKTFEDYLNNTKNV